VVLAMRIHMSIMLYTPLREAGLRSTRLEITDHTIEFYAEEMCKTFAGIADTFEDYSEALPSLYTLIMAGFSCPQYLRRWLWSKPCHLEQFGQFYVSPVKATLSILWGMPELLMEGLKSKSLQNREKF